MKRLTSIPWWAWAVVIVVPFGWAILPYFIVKGGRQMKFKGVSEYSFKKGTPKDDRLSAEEVKESFEATKAADNATVVDKESESCDS